jgi:hypothetical protein
MIDPDRRHNYMGLLSSLNIMLETREGFEATTEQYTGQQSYRSVSSTRPGLP